MGPTLVEWTATNSNLSSPTCTASKLMTVQIVTPMPIVNERVRGCSIGNETQATASTIFDEDEDHTEEHKDDDHDHDVVEVHDRKSSIINSIRSTDVPEEIEEDDSEFSVHSSFSGDNDASKKKDIRSSAVKRNDGSLRATSSILKPVDPTTLAILDKKRVWKQLPRPNLEAIRASAPPPRAGIVVNAESEAPPSSHRAKPRRITFDSIYIRNYEQTIGDNPCCSYGPPISLDWQYSEGDIVTVDAMEEGRAKAPLRKPRQMMLNYYHRRNLLMWKYGATEEELKKATQEADRETRARAITRSMLRFSKAEEMLQSVKRKANRMGKGKDKP